MNKLILLVLLIVIVLIIVFVAINQQLNNNQPHLNQNNNIPTDNEYIIPNPPIPGGNYG